MWATGPVPRSVQRLKAAGLRFALGTDMGGGLSRLNMTLPRPISDGARACICGAGKSTARR